MSVHKSEELKKPYDFLKKIKLKCKQALIFKWLKCDMRFFGIIST